MKFLDFNLEPSLQEGIEAIGFENATPVQAQAIPVIMEGKDLIACAQTGTGKTAAFLIPIINKLILTDEEPSSSVLIVSPTRELAEQIDRSVDALSYFTGISSISVYGGSDKSVWDRQKHAIKQGVDIIIATPGRLHMHHNLGYLDLSKITTFILDEADKMLDMGFYGDILRIKGFLPKERQTLMFSATMPDKIRKLAKEILTEPDEISLELSKPAEGINQQIYPVYDGQKIPLLAHLIRSKEVDSMIIFASRKHSVDDITRSLNRMKIKAKAIHSDKEQEEREDALRRFKNREFNILVATDILSRGIDIDSLSHVVNFDLPNDAEDYVHRVGRTARASATGEAITFVTPKEMRKMAEIEKLIERELPKKPLPEELGEGPQYNPKGGSRGGGKGHGGRNNRGGNRTSRNRNSRHKGRSQNRSNDRGDNRNQRSSQKEGEEQKKPQRRRRPNNRNQQGGNSQANNQQKPKSEGGDAPTKKKRRHRRRPNKRKAEGVKSDANKE